MSLSQHVRHLPKAMWRWHEKLWYSNSVRRDLLRKQRGTDLILHQHDVALFCKCRNIPTMLLPEGSHQWPAELLFISMGCFLRGKKVASLLLPESPTGSPRRGALLGRCSDRFQMLLECGRGQQRSVEASLQLWLIGVRMKLGVTFLDSDPLSLFLMLSPYPIYPLCCHVSWCLCFIPCWDGAELSGEQTLQVWLCASPLLSV